MTYAQIEQIEDFLNQLDSLEQKNPDNGNTYAQDVQNLNDQIISSVKGYDSSRIDIKKTYIIQNYRTYSGYYDTDRVKDVIKIMRSSLQAVLNSDPIYPKICELRSDIKDSENVADGDELDYITRVVEKYASTLKFSDATINLIKKNADSKYLEDSAVYATFRGVVESLKFQLKNISVSEKRDVKLPDQNVTVVQNNNQLNYQNVAVSLDLSIENCLKDLDDCETLSEKEINDIKGQLEEIKQLLADKRGKKKTIREKISAILKWIADKSTDAMIAVLPVMITILSQIK